MPSLGDSITEGTVVKWNKSALHSAGTRQIRASLVADVGDYVAQDELLAVIETDKVASDMNAQKSGVIKSLVRIARATVSSMEATLQCRKRSKAIP